MAITVDALTDAVADMAALETEFQANWKNLDFMRSLPCSNVVVTTDLAVGETLRLFVRSSHVDGSGNWVWYEHIDSIVGSGYTIPAKFTTATDEWSGTAWNVLEEYSGLVVWATAACTVGITVSNNS